MGQPLGGELLTGCACTRVCADTCTHTSTRGTCVHLRGYMHVCELGCVCMWELGDTGRRGWTGVEPDFPALDGRGWWVLSGDPAGLRWCSPHQPRSRELRGSGSSLHFTDGHATAQMGAPEEQRAGRTLLGRDSALGTFRANQTLGSFS